MRRQGNITPLEFTNFLEQGALLRHQSEWTLISGPFRSSAEPIKHAISIFCPDFYDIEKASYLTGSRVQNLATADLQFLCEEFLQNEKPTVPLNGAKWQSPPETDYQQAFADIQRQIAGLEIRKAVPVVFERAAITPNCQVSVIERARLLLHLLKAPPPLYVYGFWSGGEGLLGATPETLFVHQNHEIQTMALAGTCPKADSASRVNLLEDPKERQEHDFVVQDILEQLAEFGEVRKKGPHLLELPTLWHLKTDISVATKGSVRYQDLIRKLHPTPALGVFPRAAGYKWMEQYPGQKGRARFGAPFAFIWEEKAVCLVAIRNLQWNPKEVLIGAGGGVVLESEMARELRELWQKRQSVKKILGMNE